jgi:hypothetical protein
MTKRSTKKRLTWDRMSASQKAGVIGTGLVQLGLATTAWRDLASRPAERINGPKGLWAAIIAVNWIGPIAYFIKGRRASD